MPHPCVPSLLANQLLSIIRATGAVRVGEEFTLSSGRKSDFYFDGRKVTLHRDGAYAIARTFFAMLGDASYNTIGGPATAAIPIIGAMLGSLGNVPPHGFFLRKEAKEHGTKQMLEGHCYPGAKVVIVDDTATSGNSLLQVADFVKKQNCTVVACLVLCDRQEGAAELLAQHNLELKACFTQQELRNVVA